MTAARGTQSPDPREVLKRYWGYDDFRPKQEEIVRALLDGRDVAAVMPTGAGKSLCYQLPAVASGRLCVVVSPLIALMDDQVAQLERRGIAAGAVHSGKAREELDRMGREAAELRLLYLSPERLANERVLAWLRKLNPGFLAIDEAHCISEWGHEFRPEYRELKKLRDQLPGVPIGAFTASATRVVRHDILKQLQLRDPATFILSFDRPNLRYLASRSDAARQERLLVQALEAVPEGSVIVYSPTIARVAETVALLKQYGHTAIGYHGQMDSGLRQKHQEAWMRGEARVLVGTLAFGMGIDKPDVRAVIHLALPKSVEQYYQEAGRAGRDGEPADCLLLWQNRDKALLAHFIDQIEDEQEKRRAWQRYREITRYADSLQCRARLLCEHFGEKPRWEACGRCDNCEGVEEAAPEPVKGKKKKARPEAVEIPAALKEWRAALAKKLKVPAFAILPDKTLAALVAARPGDEEEMLDVHGMGPAKVKRFGAELLVLLRELE